MNHTPDKELCFRSPGKLMISGEYLVLHGAEALSLPVRFGQSLSVRSLEGISSVAWKTLVNGKLWFTATFSIPEFVIGNASDFTIARVLRTLLVNARSFNHEFLLKPQRLEVASEIDYDILWGLGSSSSLTMNVASWAGINPFDLHFKTYTGSGYDVATAYSGKPIIYSLTAGKPHYSEIDFNPPFTDKLWFVYLGKKKSSSEAISLFEKTSKKILDREVEKLTSITRNIAQTTDILEFTESLREHDSIISDLINMRPLSEELFRDFNGYAKYLGAWGGDFALLVTGYPADYVCTWMKKRDFRTWFPYKEIVANY